MAIELVMSSYPSPTLGFGCTPPRARPVRSIPLLPHGSRQIPSQVADPLAFPFFYFTAHHKSITDRSHNVPSRCGYVATWHALRPAIPWGPSAEGAVVGSRRNGMMRSRRTESKPVLYRRLSDGPSIADRGEPCVSGIMIAIDYTALQGLGGIPVALRPQPCRTAQQPQRQSGQDGDGNRPGRHVEMRDRVGPAQ